MLLQRAHRWTAALAVFAAFWAPSAVARLGASVAGEQTESVQGPGAAPWVLQDPAQHGLDKQLLEKATDHVFDSREAAIRDCFIVVKDGALVVESYKSEFFRRARHVGNSMTKTLGALLMGWAQSEGLVDIDADITKTYGVRSPKPYGVTVRQIMSQAVAGARGPGEAWSYDAGGTSWLRVLPEVFFQATGRKASDVWETHFAKPLGLSDKFSWPTADFTWATGSEGICLDYAKIGQLLINRGYWRGFEKPLIAPSFVDEIGKPQTRYGAYREYSNPCYGLMTWINTNPGSDRGNPRYPGTCQMWPSRTWLPAGTPSDLYLLSGLMGQDTFVVPSMGLVIVSMGDTADDYPVQRVLGESICIMFPGSCDQGGDSDGAQERDLSV